MDAVAAESSSRIKVYEKTTAGLVGLSERFKFARNFYGWTQARLASLSGVDQGTISRIEKGEGDQRISTIAYLAAAMRLSLDWLVTGEGPAFRDDGGGPIVATEDADETPGPRRKLRKKSEP